MYYLMTHSTQFIYSYMVVMESSGRKGYVFFNDTLDTFFYSYMIVMESSGRK